MSHTLSLSDVLFERLVHIAQNEGLPSVEALLAQWADSFGPTQRELAIQRIQSRRQQMLEKYGRQSDSTEIIRADRNR